jgi:TIR domain
MADVVIVNAYDVADKLRELLGLLEHKGLKVFWNANASKGDGASVAVDFRREIGAARIVLIVWSRAAVESGWVLQTADEASRAGKKVISILAGGLEASDVPDRYVIGKLLTLEQYSGVTADIIALMAGVPGSHGFGAATAHPGSPPETPAAKPAGIGGGRARGPAGLPSLGSKTILDPSPGGLQGASRADAGERRRRGSGGLFAPRPDEDRAFNAADAPVRAPRAIGGASIGTLLKARGKAILREPDVTRGAGVDADGGTGDTVLHRPTLDLDEELAEEKETEFRHQTQFRARASKTAPPEEYPTASAPASREMPAASRGSGAGVAFVLFAIAAAGGLVYLVGSKAVLEATENLLAFLGFAKGATPPLPAAGDSARAGADIVDCSVFAPPAARRRSKIIVQVFLHRAEQAERVHFQAQVMDDAARQRGVQTLQIPIARSTPVDIEIDGQGLSVSEPVQRLVWRGEPNVAAFSAEVPAYGNCDVYHPVVRVSVNGVPAGRVLFQIKVEEGAAPQPEQKTELKGLDAKRYSRAFLSYASEDRVEVLKRAQALELAGVGYFQDVLSLSPGERYEPMILKKIDEADLFMLFWSRHARASQWVAKEIDYARERQLNEADGLPDIVPVSLEDPRDVPPPERLGDRHFNDRIAMLIHYEQSRRKKNFWAGLIGWFR